MTKIFVSQSSMDSGRNRQQRRLEAKLDRFSLRKENLCEHDLFCTKLQSLPKAHCSKHYSKQCGSVKRFYDKWGEPGNQLGVGS